MMQKEYKKINFKVFYSGEIRLVWRLNADLEIRRGIGHQHYFKLGLPG